MGCDIHAFIEIKIDGNWHCYRALNIPRSYAIFEKIAGVRGDKANAIDSPRGLPDNISIVVRAAREIEDGGHSATWLSGSEMEAVETWYEQKVGYAHPSQPWGYLFGNGINSLYDPVQDVRLVCWFDN